MTRRFSRPLLVLLALLAGLALFAAPVQAQARPDAFDPAVTSGAASATPDGEITIELDTAHGKNAERSLGLALLGSALLPGTGEAYLREENSAKAFLLAEAGFWAGLVIAWQARESYLQSARNYASEYAGADAAGQGPAYLERLVVYRSYREKEHRQDSYELAQALSGQDMAAMPEWDFGSSNTPENTAHWHRYQSVMRNYRGAKVALSFAAGALVLNRVASVAHTLRLYRRTSGKGLSYRFEPQWTPEGSGIRVSTMF